MSQGKLLSSRVDRLVIVIHVSGILNILWNLDCLSPRIWPITLCTPRLSMFNLITVIRMSIIWMFVCLPLTCFASKALDCLNRKLPLTFSRLNILLRQSRFPGVHKAAWVSKTLEINRSVVFNWRIHRWNTFTIWPVPVNYIHNRLVPAISFIADLFCEIVMSVCCI